jgi:hypothetical protein
MEGGGRQERRRSRPPLRKRRKQKRCKEAEESERKEVTDEQAHEQERREQAFHRWTEELVINVIGWEIQDVLLVHGHECMYRKPMWSQLVVLVPLVLCAVSGVTWLH